MKIALFVPCFVDAFYPRAAMGAAQVLERLGHEVLVPKSALCCGQPGFNSGYWKEARPIARGVLRELDGPLGAAEAVVIPSGSCGAMLKRFYGQLFAGEPEESAAHALGERTWEFSDFLVSKLGVTDVGASFGHRVTFHDGCHGLRELGVASQPRQLLQNVRGLELVEMGDTTSCCGFGGAFATKFSAISTAMGEVKAASAVETEAEYIVSNDSSCLMHLGGLLQRQKKKIKCLHLAEVLASTS
jgi:L-lactate dehydrogenase complex protein LldE